MSFSGRAKRTTTGDHSIIVDASSASSDPETSAAGIKNSTINLTVISKRAALLESTFHRVIRSLFGSAEPSTPVLAAPVVVAAPIVHSHAATPAKAKRHAHLGNKRAPRRAPKPAAREVERRALTVTDMADQQSIYRAAVAALNDPTYTPSTDSTIPTASLKPVVNAVVSSAVSSPIVNPKSTLAASSSSPSPSVSALAVEPTAAILEPITLTVTLVAGPSGQGYVDQAGLPSSSASSSEALLLPTGIASASSSAEFASTTSGTEPSTFRKARRNNSAVKGHMAKRASDSWVKVAHF